MSLPLDQRQRLLTLLDALCDQRAQVGDIAEIERLVLASPEARWLYVTYLDLHGTLLWDTAGLNSLPDGPLPLTPLVTGKATLRGKLSTVSRPAFTALLGLVAIVLLCGILVGRYVMPAAVPSVQDVAITAPEGDATPQKLVTDELPRSPAHRPVQLGSGTPTVAESAIPTVPQPETPQVDLNRVAIVEPDWSSQDLDEVTRVSRRVDFWLSTDWEQAGITPSPRADDDVWLRRVMLDLAGRIPTVPEVTAFQASTSPDKRRELVDQLLNDGAYVHHMTTVWSNLLIGRSPQPAVDKLAFQKYLRMNFAANRPWNTIVADLLSAEGTTQDNGATNYLVAHLNNQAVPATAITAKMFLGMQLHCAQCHNHPFNDVQQSAFWELNSVFQQTKVIADRPREMTGPQRGPAIAALVTEQEGGPIYYETTNGLMKVAFPRFNGQDVDPAPEVNRRQALATLLTTTDQPQLAAAFVNRMWSLFFGAGFTTPVDDMGPHNPPCHPEVLNFLRDEFVRSGYDIKQLVRWITATEAYALSSRPGTGNANDDPFAGDLPMFSRVYPQPMSAEQLYDSLVTATRVHQTGVSDWTVAEAQRQAWLEEFVVSLQNDENGESETLSGTYAQALTVMNGELMDKALDLSAGTFLGELVRSKSSEADKVRTLYVAALSREPTAKELTAMLRVIRESTAQRKPAKRALPPSAMAYQDLFWALLNSNEFAIVH